MVSTRTFEHIARAPFNTRMIDVPAELVGLEFFSVRNCAYGKTR